MAAVAMTPLAAKAEQASLLCKTTDTDEIIDIVSMSGSKHAVLVQINGGKYFEGESRFEDPFFFVFVRFDQGGLALKYNVKAEFGRVGVDLNGKRQIHPIICAFR